MRAAPSVETVLRDSGLTDVPPGVCAFEDTPGTQVDFGPGAIANLPGHVESLGSKRVLVVTDRGIAEAGHLQRVLDLLGANGLESVVFDKVIENPTTDCVDAAANAATAAEVDVIIGLGGGSSMDTAKGCNFIHTNGGSMQDYWGHDKASRPMLPMIAIPTTAGTGSECQSYALISDAKTHAKMACGDRKAAARVAILDPILTVTQPQLVTAHTGIDALAHALETGVCNSRTAISSAYSRTAFRLMAPAFSKVVADPDDLFARSQMLIGAALAGTAIENSMLGAAHAAANPLTAQFDIVHGEAVGIMLPHVMRFNCSDPEIVTAYGHTTGGLDVPELTEKFVSLLRIGAMPTNLSSYGINETDLASLASQAASQWTAQFNPVPVDEQVFLKLYKAAL